MLFLYSTGSLVKVSNSVTIPFQNGNLMAILTIGAECFVFATFGNVVLTGKQQ